jgi:PAS domain S-box-containing protein
MAFKLKNFFGNALLYIILGLFRFLHIFMTNNYQADLGFGILYYPSSAVIYTALLFMVLLIYINEDALEARKLIYAMAFANIVMAFLYFGLKNWYHFEGLINKDVMAINFIKINTAPFIFGTVLLFLESFLVIFIFEFLYKKMASLFWRILITMFLVVGIHTLIFSTMAYIFINQFYLFFIGGLLSKTVALTIYSLLFYIFLLITKNDKDSITETYLSNFKDIFNVLTYRQKYEQVIESKKDVEKELQHKTSQLLAMFYNAPIGIALYDSATNNLEDFNTKYLTILGRTKEEILKINWLSITHPDDKEKERKLVNLLKEGKENYINLKKRLLKPTGSYFWVNLTIVSFTNEKEQRLKYLVMLEDISVQKQAEELLQQNKEKLENLVEERTLELKNSQIALLNLVEDLNEESKKLSQSHEHIAHINEELKAFTYSVSHDLKAPLRAISQLSFWLSQDYADKLDEEGQKQLSLLIGRVKRLDNLIEGLLQYSRAGKTREKELKLNLNTFIKEIVESLSPKPNITITIKNKLPNFIGDPIRIGQLFQNLIDNAIKYNDKQNIRIHIGSKKIDNFYEFYIKDNGPGIEEKYFDRIFQIFQRLESRDTLEGTGIGLSLAKRIVQIYGGKMWIKSKIGVGTTFYFTLPIQKIPFK